MNYITELGRVLKYLTEREDFIKPTGVMQHSDLLPHKMFADYLQDSSSLADQHMGGLIAKEVQLSEMLRGKQAPLVNLARNSPDRVSQEDVVKKALSSAHPNPTVRAGAKYLSRMGKDDPIPHDLFTILLGSEEEHDHNAAVLIHPDDPSHSHAVHKTVKAFNDDQRYRDSGLLAKVVRGTVYLMDQEKPSKPTWGAPSIVKMASVTSPSEISALKAHADQIVAERNVDDGPAQIGPLH